MNRAERESLCTELVLAIKEETMQLRQQGELPWHMIISEGRTVSSLLNLKQFKVNGDISLSGQIRREEGNGKEKRQEKNLQGLWPLCHSLHFSQYIWKKCSLTFPCRSAANSVWKRLSLLWCPGIVLEITSLSPFFFRPFLRFSWVFLFSGLMFPFPFTFLPFVQHYQVQVFCSLWSAISIGSDFSAVTPA